MTNREAVLDFLDSAQELLSLFARTSYAADGRGAVLVAVPQTPPGFAGRAFIKTDMTYHTLDDVRTSVADLQEDARADAAVVLRMIETYDPTRQAVVTATVGAGNPISVKLRLQRPNVVTEADGVH